MRAKDIALALLVPICWGLGFTMAKPAVEHFPPLFIMGLTYAANYLLVGAIWRGEQKTPGLKVALITACVVTIQGALIFYGYRHVTASVCTLVVQLQVPFAVLMGWLLLGEKLNARKLLGIAIAFAGVVMVVGLPEERPPMIPVMMVMAGGAVWALGQVFTRKFSRDDGPVMLRSISLHAVPQLGIASFALESGQWQSLVTATPFQWVAFGIFAFVGFFVAYSLWYTLLTRTRVDELMPFVLLMPVIGVLSAALVLGEPVTAANLGGGAVILLGVAIVTGLKLPSFSSAASTQARG